MFRSISRGGAPAVSVPALALALLAGGCGQPHNSQPAAPAPAQVAVVTVRPESIPLTLDLVGRVSATRQADVRARVAGVLLRRLYQEGSMVRQGQVLFQIDPAPLRVALDAAAASVAQAQATATNSHVTAERNRRLLSSGLVSRSDLDNAEASERSTAAAVQQAKALMETARINLGYASVRAPISGRASQQRVTEGALVGQGEATLLTTVEQIDPIYVNFDQAAIEIEQLRRSQAAGNITLAGNHQAQVRLTLQDGTPFAHNGTLDFADARVDPTTGAVALRASVPNPQQQLLPGMYVKVHLTIGTMHDAYRVPQVGLLRDDTGPYVLVVGADNKVVQKRLTGEVPRSSDWIVSGGLDDGDRIIISGIQNARPGAAVSVLASDSAVGNAPVASQVSPVRR